MRYIYYPGCSAKGLQKPYDISTRAIMKHLGADLVELEDWNCCGATFYHSVDELQALVLSARNLALAERMGNNLLTICNACYTNLLKTNMYLKKNANLNKTVNEILEKIGLSYHGSVKVRHILEVLVNDVGEQSIKEKVISPLKDFKVAPYYGCQIVRPFHIFDDPEFPTSMDRLISWIGATAVNYPLKTKCCGGMLSFLNKEACLGLIKDLLQSAVKSGAECIATCCPLCQTNLEMFQEDVNKKYNIQLSIPIVPFTQLIGLAFGLSPDEIGLKAMLVPLKKKIT